jgi:hypothetical protein
LPLQVLPPYDGGFSQELRLYTLGDLGYKLGNMPRIHLNTLKKSKYRFLD